MTIARTAATAAGSGGLHPDVLAFSSSLSLDRALWREDLLGSLAHLSMLARVGLMPAADAKALHAEKKWGQASFSAGGAEMMPVSILLRVQHAAADDLAAPLGAHGGLEVGEGEGCETWGRIFPSSAHCHTWARRGARMPGSFSVEGAGQLVGAARRPLGGRA